MQTSKSYQLQLYLQAQLLNLKKWTKLGDIQTNAYNLLQMSSTAALCLLVFLSHSLFVDYCNKQQLCLCLEGSHVNHISTHTVFSVVYLGLFQGLGVILGSLGAWGIWALKEVSDDDLTHCKTNDNKKTHSLCCLLFHLKRAVQSNRSCQLYWWCRHTKSTASRASEMLFQPLDLFV